MSRVTTTGLNLEHQLAIQSSCLQVTITTIDQTILQTQTNVVHSLPAKAPTLYSARSRQVEHNMMTVLCQNECHSAALTNREHSLDTIPCGGRPSHPHTVLADLHTVANYKFHCSTVAYKYYQYTGRILWPVSQEVLSLVIAVKPTV